MNARVLLIGGALAFLALRAARAAAPRGTVTMGPIRVVKQPRTEPGVASPPNPVNQTPAPGGGGGGSSAQHPMQVSFSVRVSGFEKLGVSASDVKAAVTDNARVLPGTGRPTVTVRDVGGGFEVVVRYPDSSRSISSNAATRAIESVDNRLQGRVHNVRIVRGA